MLKKTTKENWLYIFIMLNPLFDLLSSLFKYLDFEYTPSTFLRPIIPLFLLIYIFIIDKDIRKKLIVLSVIYLSYIGIHLYLYKGLITGISYGGVSYELQYLINYTYLIFTFSSFIYVFYKKQNKLKELTLYNTIFYIGTIYLAIVTGTSLSSYVEGVGYKGWFNTSGAVGAVLITSLFILVPYLMKKKTNLIYKIMLILGILIYLSFLIGSRVGLYGSILLIFTYLFATLINYFFNKKKIEIKKYIPYLVPVCIVLVIAFIIFGSYTLDRRKQLEDIEDDKIHIAYDLMDIKKKIDNNTLEPGYMSDEQIKALNSLYDYANENKISNIDLRKQQLVYNYYLYSYQDNIALKLFGNGYLANFGSLTLEMEGLALFFNFGIIGFILYLVPFLSVFVYGIYTGIKNIKKVDTEYMMYVFGIAVSYLISLLAGHVYFNTSVMPVIIIIHLLLLNKISEVKE